MKALAMILAGTALLFNVAASASDDDERYKHFKPEPSENLEQAIMNLTKYNAKLQEIVNGDLDSQDMAKVHELTYTLEVALARLSKELDVAANSLEEVHLGSEQLNKQRVKGFGKSYLDTLNHVLGEHSKHHEDDHKEHH
jgi:arginine utilization protein RocB